jgi:hypothetical protein
MTADQSANVVEFPASGRGTKRKRERVIGRGMHRRSIEFIRFRLRVLPT